MYVCTGVLSFNKSVLKWKASEEQNKGSAWNPPEKEWLSHR